MVAVFAIGSWHSQPIPTVHRTHFTGDEIGEGTLPSNEGHQHRDARGNQCPDKLCARGSDSFLAIGLFAGLRVSEIEKLGWRHINLPGRTIDLSWFPTKTLQPRFVPICDKLAGILEPLARAEGRVCPPNLRRLRETAVRKAGFPWKQNTCRSSFISYRLALIQDVSKVALEAGHDPQTLAAWYRKPIQKADAERYFS